MEPFPSTYQKLYDWGLYSSKGILNTENICRILSIVAGLVTRKKQIYKKQVEESTQSNRNVQWNEGDDC
jgi:hypothetical protein